jgi:hypothetical protein
MNIRAKVRCNITDKTDTYEALRFDAVYSSDPATENYSFSQATPALGLNMTISNPTALGQFVNGAEYYLDFTPA